MSSSPENVAIKQPIRRLEIQINNFNVAIPHHVDLLKRHKSNIQKVSIKLRYLLDGGCLHNFSVLVSSTTRVGKDAQGTHECIKNYKTA